MPVEQGIGKFVVRGVLGLRSKYARDSKSLSFARANAICACWQADTCWPCFMSDLPPLPAEPTPGLYRHYKGNEYRVIGLARHTETEETLVVYQALYGARGLWVRPAVMFAEQVAIGGRQVPRFERIGP